MGWWRSLRHGDSGGIAIHSVARVARPDDRFDAAMPTYYYLRLTLADGEMAWSSPIWVTP